MTEFENKVLQELANINQRLDGMDKRFDGHDKQFESIGYRFDRLEQRVGRIEKSQMILAELLPKVAVMVDNLHDDYLERKGLLRKQE